MSDLSLEPLKKSLLEIQKEQEAEQEVVRKILENLDQKKAFFAAAKAGKTGQVLAFLKINPSLINERNLEGNSAFLLAAKANNLETVQWLLKFNPNLKNQHNRNGDTALMLAAKAGYAQVVNYLLSCNVNLTKTNDQLHSAYDLATNNEFHLIAAQIQKALAASLTSMMQVSAPKKALLPTPSTKPYAPLLTIQVENGNDQKEEGWTVATNQKSRTRKNHCQEAPKPVLTASQRSTKPRIPVGYGFSNSSRGSGAENANWRKPVSLIPNKGRR